MLIHFVVTQRSVREGEFIDPSREWLNSAPPSIPNTPSRRCRPAGNTIWPGIYETDVDEGYPVLWAVLCWSGAALRLKDRDEWIDWDSLTRGSRLPFVTQLRRFLALDGKDLGDNLGAIVTLCKHEDGSPNLWRLP